MRKNIGLILLSIILNTSVLQATDVALDTSDDEIENDNGKLVDLDEKLMIVEHAIKIKKKSNKENQVSKRGYKWLKNVFNMAAAHDDFVNLAAVYYFAHQKQRGNLGACAMPWVITPILIVPTIVTMGIAAVGFIPIAGVSIGFGVQSHKYRKLKQHAKQLLISLDKDMFTTIDQTWRNGDLYKLGEQQDPRKQYEKERLERIGQDNQNEIEQDNQINRPDYDYLYEGLKCLLSRRGYDVTKAIAY
jgi:hypothetical protein